MERHPVGDPDGPARRKRRLLAGTVALGGLVVVVAAALQTDAAVRHAPGWLRWAVRGAAAPGAVRRVVPAGTRVKVEVLNASDARGAARAATFVLRDAGFDVVYFGNTSERHDSTVIRDRTGHPEWAALAAGVVEPAVTEVAPDSSRLVDLTVLVGARWTPPLQPLRP